MDVERDLEREVEAEVEAAAEEAEGGKGLPANLRVEEYVPKRQEYGGVKSSHRDLVSFAAMCWIITIIKSDRFSLCTQLRKLRREG